uniref:AlNc14C900G12617 protein n=1 Tax=Albugo laibachii Nc14 TaxID=890382 RepID=F0X288_9STRA|nr:AlNc14C900G12617 [Albugo laibachii Nc14]|eukprot:CCA27967.1 AlNc14C900G12617 [Albugo laibachii Nc14]
MKTNIIQRKFSERSKATYPDDDFELYAQHYLAFPYTGSEGIEFEISLSRVDKPDKNAQQNLVAHNSVSMLVTSLKCKLHYVSKHAYHFPYRRQCLRCIARMASSAVVITGMSYSEMTLLILENSVKPIHLSACETSHTCSKVESANDDTCRRYLNSHGINLTYYPELVAMKCPKAPLKLCILVYTGISREINNPTCIQCFFSGIQKSNIDIFSTSPTRGLLWKKNLSIEVRGMLTRRVAYCQDQNSCTKVQQLPSTICDQHWKYLKSPSVNMVEFSFKRIKGELWPPTYPVHYDTYDFDNRAVLLVRFMAKEAARCISCLVLFSEVFFAFADGTPLRYGYVWMTQSHDNIIQNCRISACSKL